MLANILGGLRMTSELCTIIGFSTLIFEQLFIRQTQPLDCLGSLWAFLTETAVLYPQKSLFDAPYHCL